MVENAPISDDDLTGDAASTRDVDRARDATWVRDALAGDPDAFGRLYDAWFDRVFHLAARIVHDEETAREVSQDAFLSAWRGLGGLEDPTAFGGWLLRIARNAAYNRSGREARSLPVDDQAFSVIEGTRASPVSAPAGFGVESRLARADDPDAAASDGEIRALVQETVAALGDRDAEVLDLQLRFDLTPAEIGEVIGLNRNAANQLCHRVRGRFANAFSVRMLWNGARPACPQLEEALSAAGLHAFGPEALAVADRHAQDCDTCEERRRVRVQPAALFAALPVLAPVPVKARVAADLTSHGVPMGGSSVAGDARPPTEAQPADGSDLPPPPPPPTGASAAGGATGAAAARRALLTAATAILLVVVLAGFVLARRDSGDDVAPHAASTESTEDAAAEPADDSTSDPEAAPVDDDTTPPTTGASTTSTSTTILPPTIDRFELSPATPQPTTYTLGPGSPTLRWSVTGATDVQVWMSFDDGVSEPQRTQLVSSDPTGEQLVCPGTHPTPTTCETAPGTYSYVLEATNQDGETVTAPALSFETYSVIR